MKEPFQVSRSVLCRRILSYKVRPMAFSEFRGRQTASFGRGDMTLITDQSSHFEFLLGAELSVEYCKKQQWLDVVVISF